jgi:hypothetical protein
MINLIHGHKLSMLLFEYVNHVQRITSFVQIVSHFGFSRFIDVTMYLDITYI